MRTELLKVVCNGNHARWVGKMAYVRVLVSGRGDGCPIVKTMDEGRERDNTSMKGGLPTLPSLYRSTIQPSRRGFYRIHVCEG